MILRTGTPSSAPANSPGAVSLAQLRPLLDITGLARGERELDDVLALIARTIGDSLGWGAVVVNLYRPAWDDFQVTNVHGDERARAALLGERTTWAEWRPLFSERFNHRGVYLVRHGDVNWSSIELTTYVPDSLASDDPDSWHPEDALIVPLGHSDGHLLGILSVDEPASSRVPSDDEIDLLAAVAAQAARAVEHVQRHADNMRHRAALEHLHEVSARLSSASSLEGALDAVAAGVARALGFQKVCVLVRDGDKFAPVAMSGWRPGDQAVNVRISQADIERLFDARFDLEGCYLIPRDEALVRCKSGSDYASVQNGQGPWAWNRHWLLAPLRNERGESLGFIWADDPDDRLLPSREKLRVLRMFANHVATALELRRTWTAEHEATELLRATIGGSPLATMQLGRDGVVRGWNAAAEKLYGWSADEIVGLPFPLVSADQRLEYTHLLQSVLAGNSFNGVEVVRETRTGEMVDVSVSGAPLYDADGNVVGGIAVHEDISRRKRAENELSRRALELEALHQTTLEVVEQLDHERALEAIVRRACDLLGTRHGYVYLLEEEERELVLAIGTGIFEDLVGLRLARGEGVPGRVWDDGETLTVGSYSDWDGRLAKLEELGVQAIVGVPLRSKDRFIGVLGLAHQDGSEFRDEELALLEQFGRLASLALENARLFDDMRQSQELHRRVLETSADSMTLFDLDGTIRFASRATETIFGWSPDELIGRNFVTLIHPEDLAAANDAIREAIDSGTSPAAVARLLHKEGHYVLVEGKPAVIRNARGEPEMILGIARDITDRMAAEDRRRELEAQLRQSQKLEAVGSLAGGIAHDFNNLLTAIAGYGGLALDATPDDAPDLRRDIGEMLAATDRARQLIRQLLAFSRKQVLQPSVLDLNTVVREMESMLRRVIGEEVDLVTNLAGDLGYTNADRSQLEQVLMNLCINARDAMTGSGGTLCIDTRNVELGDEFVAGHVGARTGAFVAVRVTDEGHGMTEEVRGRVFEPFFTTKEPTKGTGLGLSTVYGIVKQSGGYIWCDSAPAQGASFTVYLPRYAVTAETPKASTAADGGVLNGVETVLVAEDEKVVRTLVEKTLQRLGYAVVTAATGADALERLDEHVGTVDLLLTDLVMPGMNGRELAAVVKERSPETRILFMSGYAEDAVATHGVLQPGAPLLEKPFTAAGLGAKVRAVLDNFSQ